MTLTVSAISYPDQRRLLDRIAERHGDGPPRERDEVGIAWLDALDEPGSTAWDDLDRMRDELPADHPVRATVDHLQTDRAERRAASNPALAYFAERVGSEPDAFARCVVEHHGYDAEGLARCRRLLVDRPVLDALTSAYEVAQWDPEHPDSLFVLLRAYETVLGDAETPEHCDAATREILTAIFEVEVEHCAQHGLLDARGATLRRCRDWLDDCPIAGRRAELLRHRARYAYTRKHFEEALALLARAEVEMPTDLDHAERAGALVLGAWCARGLRDDAEAARQLDRVEPWVERWARPRDRGHLLVLRGLLAYRAERFAEADESFVAADAVLAEHRAYGDLMKLRVMVQRLRKERRQEEADTAEGRAIDG